MVDDIKNKMNILISEVETSYTKTSEVSGGWHHYLTSKKVSPLGTALALAILSYKGEKMDLEILSGLNLLNDKVNPDNGFGIKIIEDGHISLVESTSFVCLSLMTMLDHIELTEEYTNKSIDLIAKCGKFLVDNINPFEGWGPRSGYQSKIFSTSVALIALQRALNGRFLDREPAQLLDSVSQRIEVASNWLIQVRNDDGGWGELGKNQESTPFHTSIATMALKLTNKHTDTNKILGNSKSWLLSNWDKKYMWENSENTANMTENCDISLGDYKWSRATWNHYPTAWAVATLISLGESFGSYEIFKSTKWMLNEIKNSHINRPTDPKPPIWAIFDALSVFDTFLKSTKSELLYVSKPKRVLFKYIKSLMSFFYNHYGYVILFLYILIGAFFELSRLLTLQGYLLSLFFPAILILIDRVMIERNRSKK